MKKIPTIASASLAVSLLLSGCASMKPPERPVYTGADSVKSADMSQVVGEWQVRSLNPFPDQPPEDTVIEYRQDGSVVGIGKVQGEGTEMLGNMQFELNGDWILEGDLIRHSNVQFSSSSDNAMGDILGKIINKNNKMISEGNIYEMSANRMVIVGNDGSAMEYTRR